MTAITSIPIVTWGPASGLGISKQLAAANPPNILVIPDGVESGGQCILDLAPSISAENITATTSLTVGFPGASSTEGLIYSYGNISTGGDMFCGTLNARAGINAVGMFRSETVMADDAVIMNNFSCGTGDIVLAYVSDNLNVDRIIPYSSSSGFIEIGNPDIGHTVIDRQLIIESILSGPNTTKQYYPLIVNTQAQGMWIELVDQTRNTSNNYITFADDTGIVGAIQAITQVEFAITFTFISTTAEFAGLIAAALLSAVSVDPATIAAGVSNAAILAFQLGTFLVENGPGLGDPSLAAVSGIGVQYISSHADYAESIELEDPSEFIPSGLIVSVKDKKASLATSKADNYFVVSTAPIVLGNSLDESNPHVNVAMLGQTKVQIRGSVQTGDLIVPILDGSGLGKGVNPEAATITDYENSVGTAWTSSNAETGSVIVATCMKNKGDLAFVKKLYDKYDTLAEKIAQLEKKLNQ